MLDKEVRFSRVVPDTYDIMVHTPQGEQGIMAQRRATLSADGRYYFSTGSLPEEKSGKLKFKSLQYAWHNGQELTITPDIHEDEGYVSRIIDIP